MNIRQVNAYITTDGQLFEEERGAIEHQEDLVGVALDTLIPDIGGNITRVDRHKLLMAMFDDPDLLQKVDMLRRALDFQGEELE